MKRLICVVLCLLMLVIGLVSCGGAGKVDPTKVDRPNLTLKMAIIVDDKTTDEGIKAMQDAFNAESEVVLNTRIEFVCLRAADYEAKLDEIMLKLEDEEAKLEAGEEDAKAESTGGSDVTNTADGEFPATTAAQFDIVLVTGEDMYKKYIENGWIVGLNSYLTGTYKVLNTKILDTVKQKLTVEDEIYGIPSLRGMGEYTYLSINKKALDYYNINASSITNISEAYKLLLAMNNAGADKGVDKWQKEYADANKSFSVILNTEEDFVYPTVKYLSQDGSFSLIGALYDKDSTFGSWDVERDILSSINLLNNEKYARFLEMKYLANKEGYYGTGAEQEYLLGLSKGDYSLRFSNPDYYYCVVENPVLDNQEVFESLLCVSAFSSQAKRSIEMIQELMTNSTRSGLLNTLLYGVAQENYTLEDGVVRFRLNYNYAMHPDYMVGNLAETAYPCSNYGQNSRTYENVVQQNKDMGKRVPLFDATYERYFEYIDVEKWNDMDELSDNYLAELMECADLAAYRAKVEEIKLALTPIEKPRDEANPDDPDDPFNSPKNQFALAFMGM
ncbi:MAG: hypothetical protein J6R89_06410, partial [Clostridia bacterium]|nr:hypothetical protein [Clostridia bacterium]